MNSQAWFELSCSDALDWLRSQPSESLDLVITDPPYESLEKHRAVGTTTRLKHSKSSSNDWFRIFPNSLFEDLFKEVYRVLRRDTHFYLFCDPETMFVAKPIAESVGFRFWKPIIWDKQKIGMGYHYRARYENILFFEKGKRRLNDLSIPDVLSVTRVHRGYPTEKPVSLCEILVRQSTCDAEIVADPFMGSGAVGVAAVQLGRSFKGNDINPEACSLSKSRMLEAGASNKSFGSPLSLSHPPDEPSVEAIAPQALAPELSLILSQKICPKCSSREGHPIYKPIDDFGTRVMKNGARKYQSYCKACR